MDKLTDFCEDKRHFRPQNNAARERSRVKTLRSAFLDLQRSLPAVPPNTKLSKLDILVLATAYIYHLTKTLEDRNHKETDWQKGVSSGYGENSRSLTSIENDTEGIIMHLTDTCVEHRPRLPASTLSPEPTVCVVSDNRSKSYRLSDLYDKRSHPAYSSSKHINILQSTFLHSKHLPMKTKSNLHSDASKQGLLDRGTLGILHPVKKWPMRSRLYDSILGRTASSGTLLSSTAETSWGYFEQSRFTSNTLASSK